MATRIRRAVPADLAAVDAMSARFHAHEGIALDAARRRQALRMLLEDARLGAVLLVEPAAGGESQGYTAVAYGFSIEFGGRDAFVDEVWVEPARRGQGLGSLLLEAAVAHCSTDGIVAVHLEVGHANPRARALYERRGFRAHERHLMTLRLGTAG